MDQMKIYPVSESEDCARLTGLSRSFMVGVVATIASVGGTIIWVFYKVSGVI